MLRITAVNEEVLFCEPVKRKPTAKELFKIVDDSMKEKKHKIGRMSWSMRRCSK
jgi:hypothetical protein